MLGWDQIVLRIIIGAALGGLVGLEREIRGQAAGFRTHTLVAMGSTLFTLVSLYGFAEFVGPSGEPTNLDPSRIASQVVVGIGFLGAGAIMRHGTSVKGLTTAASLWVVAAMGLAVGVGLYVGAITVALLLLIVLRGLRSTENLLVKWIYPDEASLSVKLDPEISNTRRFTEELEKEKIMVREIIAVKAGNIDSQGKNYSTMTIAVRLARHATAQEVVESIKAIAGVLEVTWQR